MTIGYTMLGTNDPAKARAFYEPLLAQLGLTVNETYSSDTRTFFAPASALPMLVITKPHDGAAATHGNGTMVALMSPTREAVDKVYADAIAKGAKDEGPPGERGPGFYGAYFRDLDGNKLFVFKMG